MLMLNLPIDDRDDCAALIDIQLHQPGGAASELRFDSARRMSHAEQLRALLM